MCQRDGGVDSVKQDNKPLSIQYIASNNRVKRYQEKE